VRIARIRVPSRRQTPPIDDWHVRRATEEVWAANRGRGFSVYIAHDARWSRAPYNQWLGPDFPVDRQYNPHGRAGQLAALVVEQVGGQIEYLDDDYVPGRVYGTPGHLSAEEYDPPVDWLREAMEGPMPRDKDGKPQMYDTDLGEWVAMDKDEGTS
jgi:hypothetical protein